MKKWVYILGYNSGPSKDEILLAFWSCFVEAPDSDAAYLAGHRLAKERAPLHVARGLNDYVRDLSK